MTDWFKAMIERCMRRRDEGKCATCAVRKVCPHSVTLANDRPSGASLFSAMFRRVADMLDEREAPSGLAQRVTALMERCDENTGRSADVIAAELGLTRSTLYRRLAAEGTSVERLSEDVRRRLADRYLRKEGHSVKETAYRLGFSDPSAFSRAYKRWTGLSPSQASS